MGRELPQEKVQRIINQNSSGLEEENKTLRDQIRSIEESNDTIKGLSDICEGLNAKISLLESDIAEKDALIEKLNQANFELIETAKKSPAEDSAESKKTATKNKK